MNTILLCEVCGVAISTRVYPCPDCGHVQSLQTPTMIAQPISPVDEFQPGYLLRERYRIQQKVGQGGFGLVYKAWDEHRSRLVAIKQITLAALNAQEMIEATDSYNREITFLPKLHHKSLPELYHRFTDPGHWYVVMQYIEGQTLEEALAQAPQGRLHVGEVLGIGATLCDVLGYLHLQDPPLIFRDVKPANIMRSARGRIYLIDFGIARRYRDGQCKDTRPLGTPGYAAPEQYGKAQSTFRTDMYGLGATMQTLLTGREPDEIRAHGIPDDCFIPAKVQTLISQMMAPDPAQRPLSLRSTRDSMRKLQQRYPTPTPFSWWFFLWLCLAMGLEPFFVPKDLPGLPLALPLLAIVLMGYHLFKVRRTLFTGKLSGKDFRLIVEKSMDKACQWTAGMWGLSNCSLIQVAVMPLFEPIMLIKIVLYVVISFASLILISLASSRLLKKTRVVNSS